MRCTEVIYEYKFNTGNYEHELIRVAIALADGEEAKKAIEAARKIVHSKNSFVAKEPVIAKPTFGATNNVQY